MDQEIKLNESQIKEFQEVFSLFDKNRDGVITPSEIGTVFQLFGKNMSETTGQQSDIKFNDFIKIMTEKNQNNDETDEELKEAFRIFDLDGTGRISKQELESVLKILGENINDNTLNLCLQTVDLNGDGYISFDEFKRFLYP